jgi:hypothetical protein
MAKQPTFSHKAAPEFWRHLNSLPPDVQLLARKNFELLKVDPRHPSLQFKKIGKVWSVRVGQGHRALAAAIPEGFLWLWIGPHDEYDRLIS